MSSGTHWLREAKQRLEAERAANPQPVPRNRPKRLGRNHIEHFGHP